jgi:hypothetical protein
MTGAANQEPILPCLKEPAWGRQGDAFFRPLWAGAQSPYMPLVAFGYDHPHTFEFLNRDRLGEMGKTEMQLEREAVHNLRRRSAHWEPLDVKLGWFKKLRMLMCADDFLAAERILDPLFMTEAQRRLGARGLLAGVPRRGLLVVMNGEAGAEEIARFAAMVVQQFQAGDSAPISPMAFAVKDGRILALVEAAAKALLPPEKMSAPGAIGEDDGGTDEDDGEDEEEGAEGDDLAAPYLTALVVANADGQEELVITAGGDDPDRRQQGIVSMLAQSMSKHAGRPTFSGKIKLVVLGMKRESVEKELPGFEQHLKGIVSEVAAKVPNRPLSLSVEYEEGSLPLG